MALEFAGKNVLIVDGQFHLTINIIGSRDADRPTNADSIVRGTTSREIIQMAKDVGSKKVIMASCAPPIRYPNVYGIDMPSRAELVAHGRTSSEVAKAIGADLVIFQTLPDLVASVRQLNTSIERFECSVFDGQYVTGGVDAAYLDHLEGVRSDNMKTKAAAGVNGLASAQPVAVAAAAAGDASALGTSSAGGGGGGGGGGSDSTGTPPTDRPADGVDNTIGLHNTWKLS
jgi:amidophosphoribosyltransferase